MLVVAGFCVTGCAGYRVGSMLSPTLQSLHIPAFVNRCGEPLLENEATAAVLQEFQKDGSLRVVDAPSADAVLEVTLTACRLEPLRYKSDRVKTAREYRLILEADLILRETRTGKVLNQAKSLRGDVSFEVLGDLTESKRGAIPAAVADLAHSVVERVVETW